MSIKPHPRLVQLAALCSGLGWKREALDPAGPATWVPLATLTVRAGTELQLHLRVAMRRATCIVVLR